jgi:hypothetical protein
MGGSVGFLDAHAAIVIFTGAFAATLIDFRSLRYFMACRRHALALRCAASARANWWTRRQFAEVSRKSGPVALEKRS